MKNRHLKTPRIARSSKRGIALIMVLSGIVLTAALVVGLLVRASTEKSASASFTATSTTRRLADDVVNLVQAQINDATTQANTAWASQPGALRVFSETGALQRIYRLYSALHLNAVKVADLNADLPPVTWGSEPATWVDLNAPMEVNGAKDSEGRTLKSFPIFDPRDPKDSTKNITLPGLTLTAPPGATDSQPAPMPVRWLYVLEDGKISAPAPSSSGETVTVPGASARNPITGRIAFWTDDDSCKVNINTAADGAFWDIPRFEYDADRAYASKQPSAGEYQRYPGHPATTSPKEIFDSLGVTSGAYPTAKGTQSELFKFFPRYNDDQGSKLGTIAPSAPPTPKNDRLYSSVGEMLYDPMRKATSMTREQLEVGKFLLTAQSRSPELTLFGTPRISIWPVHSDLASNPNSLYCTAFDRLSAFCTTIGNNFRYHFQRKDASHPTKDYDTITRNQELYAYLQALTAREIPGVGGNFFAKYGSDRDQILTEIFDYIRTTNLSDGNLSNTPSTVYQYTIPSQTIGHGQVAPIRIGTTQGMGRCYTISEIALHLICTADGNGPLPAANGAVHDARSVSNLATAQKLANSVGVLVGTDYTTTGPNFPANQTLTDIFGGARTTLLPNEKRVQAMLLLELNAPMHGYTNLIPDFSVRINGLPSLTFAGIAPFQASSNATVEGPHLKIGTTVESGGVNGVRHFLTLSNNIGSRVNGWSNAAAANAYPYVSNPFTITGNSIAFGGGGPITIEILMTDSSGTSHVIQTFNVTFPATNLPTPDLLRYGVYSNATVNDASSWWGFDNRIKWANESIGNGGGRQGIGGVIRLDPRTPTDYSNPASTWTLKKSEFPGANPYNKTYYTATTANSDVVRSMMPKSGDVRLSALSSTIEVADTPTSLFQKHQHYDLPAQKLSHSLMERISSEYMVGCSTNNTLVSVAPNKYDKDSIPDVPGDVSAAATLNGDWDNGLPSSQDGAYFNKPDEGNIRNLATETPYYDTIGQNLDMDQTYFTPNRIIPSAGMFGSLPSGVKAKKPWQTLRFRPSDTNPANQPTPKDHYLLDLFSMPVVEPYAISEPFSTSGKINLNYQMIPFNYITRSTGIRAVLASEKVTKIPKSDASKYKASTQSVPNRLSLNLSESDGTLAQFKTKFDSGEIFKTASEICDIYLVPTGYTWPTFRTAWYGDDFMMVGDNTRERPYTNILPRVTTKSNTYTVYFTVQALKNPSLTPSQYTESKGVVISECRGSTTIERYLNPNDKSLPDHATSTTAQSLDQYYKWKVIANRQFAP